MWYCARLSGKHGAEAKASLNRALKYNAADPKPRITHKNQKKPSGFLRNPKKPILILILILILIIIV